MATINYEIRTSYRKADGTHPVRLRVTHKGDKCYLPTSHFVSAAQLTRSGALKDQRLIDLLEDTLRTMRASIDKIAHRIDTMSVQEVVRYLKDEMAVSGGELMFIAYGNAKVTRMKQGTARGYLNAFSAIRRYTGMDDIPFGDITYRWLQGFADFLDGEAGKKGTRRVSQYTGCIRHIHNLAKAEYNDEDNGRIRIPGSPFSKFKVPKVRQAEHRNITEDMIQQLIDLPPLAGHYTSKICWRNLARDMFLLSFLLMGVNLADIYTMRKPKNGIIEYRRQKTRDRREDGALMRVEVPKEASAIIERYAAGKNSPYLLRLHEHYTTCGGLQQAIQNGLREICRELGWERVTFYSARHTWATLALNRCGVDKYTVHGALNHIDKETAITDIYIAKDYSLYWRANEKVLALFDWTKSVQRPDKH